jgi:hypothetical protein
VALASQRTALAQSITELPPFMRLANTTFVNLRSALDDRTPLVNASKPVAPKLQKLLVKLRPLAIQSVPTVRDLANIVRRPGPDNDLIELMSLGQPLAAVTVRNISANRKQRLGAFPQSTIALNQSTPELAFARPYAVDLTGWFEGYSHPGGYDANGGYSRVAPVVGVASVQNGTLNFLPDFLNAALRVITAFGGTGTRGSTSGGLLTSGQGDRCPGSNRGSANGTYKIELDNAFGLTSGADFKVAGVKAGTIKSIDLPQGCVTGNVSQCHALITVQVSRSGLGSFHADAVCQSRPQSLIGEYFVECEPGTKGKVLRPGARSRSAARSRRSPRTCSATCRRSRPTPPTSSACSTSSTARSSGSCRTEAPCFRRSARTPRRSAT